MYSRLLITCVTILVMSGVIRADQPPTVEEVSKNPENYIDKTLIFDHVQLFGTVDAGPVNFLFTVKSPQGTVFEARSSAPEQSLSFRSLGKPDSVKNFVRNLNGDQYYPVRLTCQLAPGNQPNRYVVKVSRIDVVRYKKEVNLPAAVVEGITAEELNAAPNQFVGKTCAIDGVTFTGKQRYMPVRTATALEARSLAGTVFDTDFKRDQSVLFTFPERPNHAYLANGFRDDLAGPAKIFVEIVKMKPNKFRADIQRIDLIGFGLQKEISEIEKVDQNPRSYEGQMLIFDDVKLVSGLVSKDGFTLLSVRTTRGRLIPAEFQPGHLTVSVAHNLQSKLKEELKESDGLVGRLTCCIRRKPGSNFWLADICQIELLNDGQVRKVIDSIPPGSDADTQIKGITGKWQGKRKNDIQGDLGTDLLVVREFTDGKIIGDWSGMTVKNGIRVSDDLLTWEVEGGPDGTRYRARCTPSKDGQSLLIKYTFYYKKDGNESSYEGESRLIKR